MSVSTWRRRVYWRWRRLLWQVLPDPLTKLASPAAFALRAWPCRFVAETTLAVIDLDGFAYINDRFGHLVGDEVLVAVASQLRTRYPQACARKRPGSRFVVVLPGIGPAQAASDLAGFLEHIDRGFQHLAYVDIYGVQRTLTASVGVARATRRARTRAVMAVAEDALREAKRSGGGQVRIAGL